MNVKKIWNVAKGFVTHNSPAILTGVAVVGVVATAIAAYKAAPVADDILKKHKQKTEATKKYRKKEDVKQAKKEQHDILVDTVQKITPVILPPIVLGTLTIGCIFGSHNASSRRIAVLSAAYSMADSSLKDITAKMNEMLGVKKTRDIKDAVMKDKLKKNPPEPEGSDRIILTGDGDVLCKDLYAGSTFRSNAQKIGSAINWASAEVRNNMYVSLNDFYEQLNIKPTPMGDDLGWNVDDLIGGTLPITYTAILTDDERPCLCLDYVAGINKNYRAIYPFSV